MVTLNKSVEDFRKLVASPAKFRLFMLAKLPMAYMADLKVVKLDYERAAVSIPYKYLNKNPFGSIYFACLGMAAELSTGVLCMMYLHKASPAVSMLVVHMAADFTKKATGKITFTCEDGKRIYDAIEDAKTTGQSTTVKTTSIGLNQQGEQVATFHYTWSFKAKSNLLS